MTDPILVRFVCTVVLLAIALGILPVARRLTWPADFVAHLTRGAIAILVLVNCAWMASDILGVR